MSAYKMAYKEFCSLASRYRFIGFDLDINEAKQTIEELLFWADWEKEQVIYNDEISRELERSGKSIKQINAMQDRALKALDNYIFNWSQFEK